MKLFKQRLVSGVLTLLMLFSMPVYNVSAKSIDTMTPQEIVKDMKIGWNLGNALECTGGGSDPATAETYWGNPVTTKAMIDAVKNAGFNTVRIPVTWYEKCTNGTINSNWLARVKEVVDYCYDNNMYVIINLHHEEDIIPNSANKKTSIAYIENMWGQIATYFKSYDRHLIFEAMNEPRIIGSSEEWTTGLLETRQIISEFNKSAVDIIRNVGGNNSNRLIMCPSNAAKIPASTGFTLPDDDNIVLSVHNYSPYDFAMNGGGTTTWGSDSDKNALDTELKDLYNRFVSKGTPVVIGEMGATNKNNTSARQTWAEYYIKQATSYGITCIVWDNNATNVGAENFGLLNRSSCNWYYPTIVQSFMTGYSNSTPYVPTKTEENETIIYEGSSTASAWGQAVILDTMPYLSNGYYIEITYTGANSPVLCLQNTATGEWNQINADTTANGVATYSYETIQGVCKSDYTNQNQLLVMANGVETTVTKISVFSSQDNKEENTTVTTKTVLFSGSSTAQAWDQPVTIDELPDISTGDYITVKYSGDNYPYLVFQRYSVDEWNQMLPDKVENGVAYYSYATIINNCTSDYSLQEQMLVMSNNCTTTVTEVALLSSQTYLLGDVNLDNVVDKKDAALILKHVLAGNIITDLQGLSNGDYDNNSLLNILDAVNLIADL